jgi:hypothetical protein
MKYSTFLLVLSLSAVSLLAQIVIVVSVQSANGALFLHSLQLPVDIAVISAALCLDAKPAVRPQLPLGAETVWSLQDA